MTKSRASLARATSQEQPGLEFIKRCSFNLINLCVQGKLLEADIFIVYSGRNNDDS
jgi:hypothetical protein